MDGSLGPQREPLLEFQPGASWDRMVDPAPEDQPRIPEPEWNLSASQVALLVIGIIAFCELIGRFF